MRDLLLGGGEVAVVGLVGGAVGSAGGGFVVLFLF